MDHQTTLRALINPYRERQWLTMPTRRTGLTRIRRVHSHHDSTSFLRFVEQMRKKQRPRGIGDTFGQSWMFDHIAHHECLHRNQPEALDQFADCLLNEVCAPVADPLMDASHHLAL